MRCDDSAVKWNGIGGVSEVNETGVHLVWNDFICMVDVFQQNERREESRIANEHMNGEARCFPVCVDFTVFIRAVGAEMGEMP